jgi:hypothetical protein
MATLESLTRRNDGAGKRPTAKVTQARLGMRLARRSTPGMQQGPPAANAWAAMHGDGHGNLTVMSERNVLSLHSIAGWRRDICGVWFHGLNIIKPSVPGFYKFAPVICLPQSAFTTGAPSAGWEYQPR